MCYNDRNCFLYVYQQERKRDIMALTKEYLQAIAGLLEPIYQEIGEMKTDIAGIKTEQGGMKTELGEMKTELGEMKTELGETNRRLTSLELHIENATDKNIQLLAENFVELTKKLNQAIPVADKNLAYEVKVNYLLEEMDKVKADVAELKNKIA